MKLLPYRKICRAQRARV